MGASHGRAVGFVKPELTATNDGKLIGTIKDSRDIAINELPLSVGITNVTKEALTDYKRVLDRLEQSWTESIIRNKTDEESMTKLSDILDNFQVDKWGELSLDEQKRCITKLADFISADIGINNTPQIVFRNDIDY